MKLILKGMLGFGALAAMLISGCATTELTSTWKSPSYRGRPKKIMVIRITKNPLTEKHFEDEFVRRIKARGTDAVASYAVMPEGKHGDRAIAVAMMKEQGADAVLISRLVSKKTVDRYVPGTPVGFPIYYGTFGEYYDYDFHDMATPGYMAEDDYSLMEANLYDAGDNKLIWSAVSETEIQGSNQGQMDSYINAMVHALARQKLLR